jgi:hypothetical protein
MIGEAVEAPFRPRAVLDCTALRRSLLSQVHWTCSPAMRDAAHPSCRIEIHIPPPYYAGKGGGVMTRGLGLLCILLLVSGHGQVRAQSQSKSQDVWICTLIESHHFTNGKDTSRKGGGDYRIDVKPPVINLTANGHFIIGYDIAENTVNRLLGQRGFDAGGGETRIAKLALDKLNGRIVQTGMSHKGGSEELVELINGSCKAPR